MALNCVVEGLTFPEGPRWRDGKLWFSDFYSHRVLTVDAAGRVETVVEVPQRPSGLGFTPDGALLIVSMLDRRLLCLEGRTLRVVADLWTLAGGPCNDMVVDGAGRAYVGNFGFDRHRGEEPRTTCLARVDPDGKVLRAAEDLMFPNGTAITPDGQTMIVAETWARRLTAFDVAPDGALSNRRVFAELANCFPDGICLDAEGAVWVTDARHPRLLRVVDGGRIERTITTGDRPTFACMLGGDDRRTLYVCTCTGSGPAMAEKRDGRIEAIRVEVPGAGWP
ncbi:MAG: SMP-30/gluconolactonase/LRE family protein [Candidatus Rokubacteria bacterium]|nr:SMP-30/gluconolactonase/LRE family protein [Candidatus Rokubacteria bacterium]